MRKPQLIGLEQVDDIPFDELVADYRRYVSPGIARNLDILGTIRYRASHAEGMYLYTDDGREFLDFSAGMNVLNHGHNHPRIMAARRRFNERKQLEMWRAFVPLYQAFLAKNLATIFPGDLRYSFFCNSGAEANEGAMKMASLFHTLRDPAKNKILFTDLGYHGKTFGAMSVSGPSSRPYKELFQNIPDCVQVPWGNLEATREVIDRHSSGRRNDVACMILEAIKGDIGMMPPPGYMEGLAELLAERDILMICDEVFTGFGRTGKWFGFDHFGVVPDLVSFSKSLGGGKASIAGYIAKSHIFERTYASARRCDIHSTTFGGMAEEAATAIEALNIIVDEGLVERAAELGEYMAGRMRDLARKHPKFIKEARCTGLLGILEMHPASTALGVKPLRKLLPFDELLEGLMPALVITRMIHDHQILVYSGGRQDILFLNPSLIVEREQIDRVIDTMDQVLRKPLTRLAMKLATDLVETWRAS